MKKSKSINPVLGNAMIWAAMLIASSLLMADSENSKTMMLLLVGGWLASHKLIPGAKKALAAECAMFRRMLGRSR